MLGDDEPMRVVVDDCQHGEERVARDCRAALARRAPWALAVAGADGLPDACCLCPSDVGAVADALTTASGLVSLELVGCGLEAHHAGSLARALKGGPHSPLLRTLSLRNNRITVM